VALALPSIAVALVLTLAAAVPVASSAADTCPTKPIVVRIHADWCRICQKTESTWKQVQRDFAQQATVVKLDVSDRVALQGSSQQAEELGIGGFFSEYRSRTGTVAVLDCRTRKPVAILSGESDIAKYREAISKARHAS
jgi:thiol-disulfide isomerase/thioredoxin